MKKLLNTIIKTIEDEHLLEPGDRVLLAVSGGPDSVFMARVFHQCLSKRYGLGLYIAHFNHQLRGRQSDRDQEFMASLARELKLPFFTAAVPVSRVRKKGQSLEDAGRQARYAFLLRTARQLGCNKIATAHHRDDQVETFFLRIFRGSGFRGMRGILAKREDGVIRPLLNLQKLEIMDYLKRNKIPYRLDKSNRNEDFLRNRVRRKLIPFIIRQFGTGVIKGICTTQKNLIAGYSPAFSPLPVKKPAATTRPPAAGKPSAGPAQKLKYPGTTILPDWGLRVTVSKTTRKPGQASVFPPDSGPECLVNAEKIIPPLQIRSYLPGDRFWPLGSSGSKKVGDFFTDRKIPLPSRTRVPLICDRRNIIWIPGFRLSHLYRVLEKSNEICHIYIENLKNNGEPRNSKTKPAAQA
jgi:tRNA(Ile)-lysidine synthetase-like protein